MKREEKWFIANKSADFKRIGEMFNISPILSRLIRNRDIISPEEIEVYLNGTISDLGDGMMMKDMDIAVDILREKIGSNAHIRVIGDYDIDGVSGTYILEEGIRLLGGNVDTDIPDRMTDGYGLNILLIDRALADGVDTIITCDNGISACEEIAYGKAKGLTIIVTDHHRVPYVDEEVKVIGDICESVGSYSEEDKNSKAHVERHARISGFNDEYVNEEYLAGLSGESQEGKKYKLPPADAVVNPHQEDCLYPFKELCGAAVAYKVVETLFDVMDREVEDIDYLIENVAMATIGDVMDLNGENRIFVKEGLERLRRTKNLGLQILMEVNHIEPKDLSAYHLGFVIGPCINASGRLDTAKMALDLLNSKSQEEAHGIATELKALNDQRKNMTQQALEEAIEIIEEKEMLRDKVLVVYLEDCHQSIAGIVAGRVRDRYYRPVIILTPGSEEGQVKGSGRSIEAYDLHDGLCGCSDLLIKFGGHKVAAGLTLSKENVEPLKRMLNEKCELTKEELIEKITIDIALPFRAFTLELIEELKRLEPFGKGNKTPLFATKDVEVSYPKVVGANENVLSLGLKDLDGTSLRGVYFGEAWQAYDYIKDKEKIDVIYNPKENEYNGVKSVNLVVKNYR